MNDKDKELIKDLQQLSNAEKLIALQNMKSMIRNKEDKKINMFKKVDKVFVYGVIAYSLIFFSSALFSIELFSYMFLIGILILPILFMMWEMFCNFSMKQYKNFFCQLSMITVHISEIIVFFFCTARLYENKMMISFLYTVIFFMMIINAEKSAEYSYNFEDNNKETLKENMI